MIEYFKDRQIWLHSEPVNMQKSFRGLSTLVDEDKIFSGDVFIFMNRRRKLLKGLYWDDGGFCIFHKNLERGTFQQFETENGLLSFADFLRMMHCCKPMYFELV